MNSDIVTTSFGRRRGSLCHLASQFASRTVNPDRSIDKWKLFRAICEARPMLGITDRSLAVLNALISFYPKAELCEENGLVVFPSNQQLSLRAHGMPEQTLRRHLATLIDAGLILRKDSPNGKRYARKDRSGTINDAYGFSLAPLINRADEIQSIATQVIEERLYLQSLRDKISICRRDIIRFSEIAIEEQAAGNWEQVQQRYLALKSTLNRKSTAAHLTLVLDTLTEMRQEMANWLENHIENRKISANAYQNERLIQSSESESLFETAIVDKTGHKQTSSPAEPKAAEKVEHEPCGEKTTGKAISEGFDLQTVVKACPEIALYGPNGAVRSWYEMKQATSVVRTMLSISQSAYDEAEKAMGVPVATTIIACILERSATIQSPGGYLRNLTEKAVSKQFSIKPMLMSLLRARLSPTQPTIRNVMSIMPTE